MVNLKERVTEFLGSKNQICSGCGKPWPCKCMTTGETYKNIIRNATLEEIAREFGDDATLQDGTNVAEIIRALRE